MKLLSLLLLIIIVPLIADAQTVYRWVDKDGKVHYSDTAPPADTKNVQQKRLSSGAIVETENIPAVVRVAMERNPVSAYLTNCGQLCDDARALLTKRGIPYTLRDPDKNPADAQALNRIAGGLDVPLLQVGDRAVKGFDELSWNSALDAGGYPKTSAFTKPPQPKLSEAPPPSSSEPPPQPPAPFSPITRNPPASSPTGR